MKIHFKVSMHGQFAGTFSVENRDHLIMFHVLNNGTVVATDGTDDIINGEEISHELREQEVFQLPKGFGFSGVKYECCRAKHEITAVNIFLIEIEENGDM